MTRTEAERHLLALTARMNTDALRVLAKFAGKIVRGGEKHGDMDLVNDPRDWHREQQDERCDDACYGYMAEVQAEMFAEMAAAVNPIEAGLRELVANAPFTGEAP